MKALSELLKSTLVRELRGPADAGVEVLTYDSRRVGPGACFFAVAGTQCDGHDFIASAVEKGAVAVVCRRLPDTRAEGVAYVAVDNTAGAMADMAAAFYDDPSRRLRLVGVTGTNGKTTTATLLYDLVRALGHKAGLISTVVYKIDERTVESTHTTPDPIRLNAMMREMVDAGCDYCFMECSSHAIVQERTRGLHFAGGLFSNITHDHLDYHKTFAAYIRAKQLFFDALPAGAFALTNVDDRNGRVMVQNTRARVATCSLRSMADFRCKIVEQHLDGMLLRLDGQEVWTALTGRFNAYNLLTVYGAACLLGFDRAEVLRVLSALQPVSGRFEVIRAADGTTAVVDYAHTPDALENVIRTIEEIRTPAQQLIVVCGCGGDRDRTKRPEMAAIAVKYAATAVFTSDNPRHESPAAILDEMTAGLDTTVRYLRIEDRAEAIRTAAMLARPGDILLVAGKGHEDYQIVGDEKRHFDDREEVRKAFAMLNEKLKMKN
ncbi:MAG: UDP-N-acetylmuramoyl-L-alanyl-D-glutamate--2,6-diaminopimelate ligase [Alistipes sp.]|nr:UDP-N-acetylmuramoyl-L-alanyl-D-glutamate--2,6-diaminopimelate ligase [Alistipes sp.]